MKKSFIQILEEHAERYPMMQPQDYGKLIFQSEFGPEHMVRDQNGALSFLQEEMAVLSQDASPWKMEDVGGELCRFPLSACPSDRAVRLLAELFVRSAAKSRGTAEGIMEKTRQLLDLQIPKGKTPSLQIRRQMEEWVREWKKNGFPPVHHSETYRKAYRPHYRLIQKEYAVYFPALLEISRLIEQRSPVVIGVDGRCGSGKTGFASLVESLFSCNVLHMDDFYLPPDQRAANWNEVLGGNIDFDRFYAEALSKARLGEALLYRPYCCKEGKIKKELPLPPRILTVVEGSYSLHPQLRGNAGYDFKIFLTCSKKEQERRLKEREGSHFTAFREKWIPMEEHYFSRYAIEESCDLQLETDFIY